MPLYCFLCATNCFYCEKKHPLPPDSHKHEVEFNVDSITKCNNWCLYLNRCKSDSDESICCKCLNKKEMGNTIDKDFVRQSISPITTNCDAAKTSAIHKSISELLSFQYKAPYTVQQWRKYFFRKFTHFNPQGHNVFSMNIMNTQPVDGMFLSSLSIDQILASNKEFKVTEEMFNFFVDTFDFYGEYDPSTQQRCDKLPGMLFCKPKDGIEK